MTILNRYLKMAIRYAKLKKKYERLTDKQDRTKKQLKIYKRQVQCDREYINELLDRKHRIERDLEVTRMGIANSDDAKDIRDLTAQLKIKQHVIDALRDQLKEAK